MCGIASNTNCLPHSVKLISMHTCFAGIISIGSDDPCTSLEVRWRLDLIRLYVIHRVTTYTYNSRDNKGKRVRRGQCWEGGGRVLSSNGREKAGGKEMYRGWGGKAALHQHTRAEPPQCHAQRSCCSPGKPCAGRTTSTRSAQTP